MTRRHAIQGVAALTAASYAAARTVRARRAIDFAGRSALIFGGSRGLGLVMARQLVGAGARVALAARDRNALEQARYDLETIGGEVTIDVCDVTDRHAIERTIERIVTRFGTIDVLINNAGIIQVGPFDHMTVRDYEEAMATHFWGPLFAIQAALPHMRKQGAKRIVNVSSIGGKIPVPHLMPYTASKFALTGLSESLHAELAAEGFRVTTVCPGLMRTGSTYNAWFKGQHRREFTWFHMSAGLPALSIDARRAASQILDACRHGDSELILTPAARCAVLFNAVSPGLMGAVMSVVNRLLPAPARGDGDHARSGWQSASGVAPSPVTVLADRATLDNNETPVGSGQPRSYDG
jgi:NAD(P)-dependent dehydrogenase (short-subunit alcohol dehydrogenase family)